MWGQIEFAAEEEDACAVVLEAAETSGGGLDGLDAGVEAFGEGVGDAMDEIVEQAVEMGGEGAGDLLERLQFGAHHLGVPLRVEAFGRDGVGLLPKLREGLLAGPRPGRLQVALAQLGEAQRPLAFDGGTLEPKELGVLEALVALFEQTAMLLPPHLVHRLVEQLRDVEAVMRDLGVRDDLASRRKEVGTHVHARRRDLGALLPGQALPQGHGGLACAVLHHLQDARLLQVGHHRDVVLPPSEPLLVQTHINDLGGRAPDHAALHGPIHDTLHAVPVQAQQLRSLRQRRAGLKHLHREGLEQKCEARARLGPGRHQGHDPVNARE